MPKDAVFDRITYVAIKHFLHSENSIFMNYMKCVFQRESVGQWEFRQLFSGSIMISMPAYPLEHVTDIDYIP